jgi:hypothetical protein
LIESGPPGAQRRLHLVQRSAVIVPTLERDPLVLRTVNPQGVMGAVQRQEEARQRHERDMQRLVAKYGDIPW